MYDLKADPEEKNNVIEAHGQADLMKTKLKERISWWNAAEEPVYRVTRF